MKRALPVAALGAVAASALALLLLRNTGDVKRFEFYAAPLTEGQFKALGARPGWQPRVLDLEPGVQVRGLVRPPTNPAAPWVLFFPGNSGTLLAESQRFLEAFRGSHDLGIAVYAYRGFDGSSGKPGSAELLRDAARVYERTRTSPELAGAKLHLVSFSLGCAIAASVASQTTQATRPASVTLLAPPTELDIAEKGLFARLQKAHRFETLRFLGQLAGPTLVVSGEADTAFPVQMARTVRDKLGARARYLELSGVGHLQLLEDPRTFEAVWALIAAAP